MTDVAVSSEQTSPDTPALELRGVSCSYGGIKAVRDVSLSVPRGQFLGLIGPNGAGKSTLISCMSGYNKRYTGGIFVHGNEVSRKSPEKVARHGLIRGHQSARAFGEMTCLANVAVSAPNQRGDRLVGALIGGWRSEDTKLLERSGKLLHNLGLADVVDSYAREISGGQQRLLELARLLMAGPTVLVLDEPFVGVSPQNRARLVEMLAELVVTGELTVVMVEHRLDLVEQLCDHVVVMAEGAVLAAGTMEELRRHPDVLDAYLGRASAPVGVPHSPSGVGR